ncbi:MAG: MerR family transcriptional regulator [Cellulosilyticaceae bacterium]
MDTYFSIGEIAKLANLPIKTLRYYDEVGLLKPAYVNEENNYRYYSYEQFITIDVIKNCKLMGMPLGAIKKVLDSNVSIEEMREIIQRQSALVEEKIEALSQAKAYMETLEGSLTSALSYNTNEVFIKYNKARRFYSYPYRSHNTYELEMNLRKVILEIESASEYEYARLGTAVSYAHVVKAQQVVFNEVRNFAPGKTTQSCQVLPEGEYVTLLFDDNSGNTLQYYQKMMTYIAENGIEVTGDFNETWIMPRVDGDKKEKTLTRLDILKKN